jgi:heat-inducible transcriptional repressor
LNSLRFFVSHQHGTESDAVWSDSLPALSDRQGAVLRAIVAAYVGEAAPVGSATVSHLLATRLSSASIRNTMAELAELGLIEKAHHSSGRVPTEEGLRLFVDRIVTPSELAAYEQRSLDRSFEGVDADASLRLCSQLLSEHSRQLGFVVAPTPERALLRHVSLVRLSTERLLVVLVSQSGHAHQRVIDDPGSGDQTELDRMALELNQRVAGRSLAEVRRILRRELGALRARADHLMARALRVGLLALGEAREQDPAHLVISSWLSLLEQPEFRDAGRLRALFEAIETSENLLELVSRVLEAEGVSVALGEELEEPGLRHCAVVAAPYGDRGARLGVVGVLGPHRMDYGRNIALVSYCSRLVTEKLGP